MRVPRSPARRLGRPRFGAVLVALAVVALGVGLFRATRAERDRPTDRATPPAASPAERGRPLPRCGHGDRPAPASGYEQWRRTLVDTTFRLASDYQPPGLVAASAAGFEGPHLVRDVMVEDLAALGRAAAAAGAAIQIEAAFRTFEQQAALFERRVAELGRDAALRKVARPGHSEHQLGTAVDFKTAGAGDVDLTWESTPAGAWMAANAHRYGFVMSYPSGLDMRTCYAYEPWHFRYYGRDLAAAIAQSGLVPREFLWRRLATPGG